jgi:NAD-dependent SIR2 family protein deacetylase
MLSDEFDRKLLLDREEVDLLIVIGTSLRVSLSTLITFSTNSVVSGISRRSDCQ